MEQPKSTQDLGRLVEALKGLRTEATIARVFSTSASILGGGISGYSLYTGVTEQSGIIVGVGLGMLTGTSILIGISLSAYHRQGSLDVEIARLEESPGYEAQNPKQS